MTEALAHVDTAETQFATVASDEEYESKQRDLQRLRGEVQVDDDEPEGRDEEQRDS